MAERQPNHVPDPQRAPHEGGNGSSGLPPTVHEQAKPPPDNQESNAFPPRSQEEQSRPRMRDVVGERMDRELARRREGRIFPATTDGMQARFRQIEEVRNEIVASLTPEERGQYEIEHLIVEPLISHRITRAESKPAELLDTMRQLDPKFMDPIITGIKKRPAREAKRARALQRLFPNLNEEQIRQMRSERANLHLQRKVDRHLPPSER